MMNDDIDAVLRRLDRPITPSRSQERRQLVLEQFDEASARRESHEDSSQAEIEIEHVTALRATSARRAWMTIGGSVAAVVLLVAGLVALTRPEQRPIDSAAAPIEARPSVHPMTPVVLGFCADDLAEVGSALARYGDGVLGAGGNVAPLKQAVVGPLAALLDSAKRLGFDDGALDALRADIATLENTYLPVQVQTRIAEISADLGALLDSGLLPGSDACDTDQLIGP